MSETTQYIPALHSPASVVESAPPSGWSLGDRYQVVDRLGSGGMADVFRAYDSILGRAVAVKVFRSSAARAAHDVAHERREAEVRALAALNHPNLVTLFDASLADSPPFLVLELIEGPALSDRLVTGPLSEADMRSVGAQIADALAYVHARDMVHRDVKPANILLGVDGTDPSMNWRARLSDFGIVRVVGTAHLTGAELTVGSASYLAPEQARGGEVGPAADIYSLGLVLIEALTGQRCFDGAPMEALAARLVTSPQVPHTVSPTLAGLLTAMTAMDPAARPPAGEVARQLREPDRGVVDAGSLTMPLALAALPVDAGAVVPAAEVDEDLPEPGRRTHRALVAAILLSVIAAGIVLILNSGLPSAGSKAPAPAGDGTSVTPSAISHQVQQRVQHTTSAAAIVQRGSARASATRPAPSTAAAHTPHPTHSAGAPVPPPSVPVATPTPTPTPTGTATGTPTGTPSPGDPTTSPGGVLPS